MEIKSNDGQLHLYVPEGDIQFLHDYSQVSFGWDVAARLAAMGKDFPVYLSGQDSWVYKAWAALRYGAHNLEPADAEIVRQAWAIANQEKMSSTCAVLKALLLSSDASIERAANDLSISPALVEAFEVLFFNVIGRRDDHLFLRNVVYPNSRLEEMLPEYAKSGSMDDMMMRIGYNSDRRTALFIGGFRPRNMMDASVDEASSAFQQQLMQTGAVMASSGLLWLDRSHTTISAARNFLQTSKLSGETVSDGQGMLSLADSFRGEVDRLAIGETDKVRKSLLAAEGD